MNFDLPSHLSSFGLLIGKEGTESWDDGIGTGPYRLDSWDPGVRYLGRKFENFYRDDQGHFEVVELLNVPDAAARASALLSNSLDVIGSPDVKTATRLGGTAGFDLIQVSGTQHYTTDMRTDAGPLADPRVRNAVKWGVRRQEIVDKVLGGFATIGNDLPLARNQKFYNDALPQREFDPDKAKWHLKQAGLDGVELTFHTSDGAFAGAVDMGVLMQQSLAEAGIDITVKREPADGYWSEVWMTGPWVASYYNGRPTADWMLISQYGSGSKWDATHFRNAEFDALLTQARAAPDEAKRRELYFEAQRLCGRPAACWWPPSSTSSSPRATGWDTSGSASAGGSTTPVWRDAGGSRPERILRARPPHGRAGSPRIVSRYRSIRPLAVPDVQ